MTLHISASAPKGLTSLLILFSLCLSPPAPRLGSGKKTGSQQTVAAVAEYRREVFLASSTFQDPLDKTTCIYVQAFLTSSAFFEGLTLTDTQSGLQFHKHGQLVNTFPDTLMIKLEFYAPLVTGCAGLDTKTQSQSKLGRNSSGAGGTSAHQLLGDLLNSLRFQATWVRQSSEVPAESISASGGKAPLSGDYGFGGEWDYEFLIRSKGVPLTDQVGLSVVSQDGQVLTRIAGGLASPLSRMLYGRKVPRP